MDFDFKNSDVKLSTYRDGPTAIIYDGDTVTTNLGMIYRDPDVLIYPNYVYLDTNNCPGIDKALEESGYGEPLVVWGQQYTVASGFCEYPVYKLDFKKIFEDHPEAKDAFLENVKTYVEKFAKGRAELYLNDPFYSVEEEGPIRIEEMGAPALQYLSVTGAFTKEELTAIEESVQDSYQFMQQQIDAMQGLKSSEVNDEPDDEHDVDDEDSLSDFDKDFVTDADIEDGFTESDGARFERESMIPTEIDDFIEDEEEEADSEYDDYGE